MNRRSRLLGSLGAILLFLSVVVTFGVSQAQVRAPAVDVLKVNLDPLIDAAAKDRNRFAVNVPYSVNALQVGTWSVSGGIATWRYSLQIPTAVSLSFHATNAFLPPSAQLTVRGGGSTYTYRAADTNKQEIWSRISKGDSLDLELTVAPRERRDVVLQISSLQAGYRGFGHAVSDHPHYARLKLQTRVASTSTCIVNYECDISAANTPAGQATVAIIVGNSYQCSGTLINDVPQDGKPYVLTARHCESGKLGGGKPSAASDVVVYWDATSACGSPLGTLYDPGIPAQQGAVTAAEQQDAWLLLLNAGPIVNDAYLAGFDATGGEIHGGYTVHHALSNDKQFTAWNGQAVADAIPSGSSLNVDYTSNFWDVVNRIGTIGPGASGSALFDQNDRVVGSLSLGKTTASTDDGYDACPSSPPANPDVQNASAFFTSLSAVWNSTADPTSHTQTIKQVLDPNNTASLVVNSMRAPVSARISASQITLTIGFDVALTWSAPSASSCSASGGSSGDGWAGTLSSGGSQTVRESAAGAVTFGIICTFPDGHISKAQTVVTWVPPAPLVNLFAPSEAWVGGTWTLTWSTNSPPCQLTGGSASQVLNGTYGTISVNETTVGKYDYHITCGIGSQVASEDAFVTIVPPVIKFVTGTTDLRLGQVLELGWSSLANSCTPSGGAANDGWSQTQAGGIGGFSFFPTTLGTYTYTITCAQGTATARATATITVENDPPYANLTVSTNEIAVGQSMTISYKSNIAECTVYQNSVGTQAQGIFQSDLTGGFSEGTRTYSGGNVGASQLILSCGTNPTIVTSTPQTVTVVAAVNASISAPPTATTGSPFTLSWQTSDASSCSATGDGADANQWSGNVAVPSGQQNITPTVAGTLTYTLTCVGHVPTDTNTVKVAINVTAPASQSPPPTSNPGGSSNGGSGGSGGSGGGGGGGGGAFDGLTLAVLALAGLLGWQNNRHRRVIPAIPLNTSATTAASPALRAQSAQRSCRSVC
jgi:hypothetical protein